jgi:6-phosphofructokinase 2
MQAIVTLTMNPTVDVNVEVDRVDVEEKLRCADARYEAGGGGVNVSRAIHKLGGQSLAIYPSGGSMGRMLQNLLEREGLVHRPVPIEGTTRQCFNVLEKATGKQLRFILPGPVLREPEWQRCLDEVSSLEPKPRYVVASGSLARGAPEDLYARVARIGRELHARVIVDTSGKALPASLREGVYLIKPNLRELEQLTERRIEDEAGQEQAARSVIDRGQSEVVVLSLGKEGALVVSKEGSERVRAPSVPVQSKVGAGDSMVAGVVLGLARGLGLSDAVRFGVAAGAAAAMTPGTELCRREDAERLNEQVG